MREIKKSIFILCFVVFPAALLYSEGTKQVKPDTNSAGQLCINKSRNDFAFYDASPEFRLNISIGNTSESIRFGFGKVLSNTNSILSNMVFRIKNPAGNVVYGPFAVPASGKGFIASYTAAVAGPFAGGYDYLEYHPLTTGEYYLEFYYPPVYTDDTRHYLEFFDITVVNATGMAKNGRVWSKAWQFWSGDITPNIDRFYGKLLILSDDSIVSQVNCNGLRGGSFSFSSNMTGCATTGNLVNDRMSKPGFHTYPQYKVFLNDPDSILFPTQKVTSGIIQPITVNTDCTSGGAEFGVRVLKDGTIRLLIQVNPSPGIDPEDVQLIADAKADPGGTGYNSITWDGKDNYGRPVLNGTKLAFSVTNLSGMSHLPIYDIENNDYGYIVTQIRPAGGQLRIYWDDTNITGGTSNTSTGCINAGGCHNWTNEFGNSNTINSWWFVSWTEISGIPFVTKRLPEPPVITGKSVHCKGPGSLTFSVANDPNTASYNWTYSGTGVAIAASGTTAALNFATNASPGRLSVYGNNNSCGNGPATSLEISIEPLPVVSVAPFPDMCYTAPGFRLAGGQPDGGSYFVDGEKADSLFPYKETEGLHSIVYTYAAPTGCSNSDTTGILLRTGADCQGTVFFPNAFTPDGDSLNDTFRPVTDQISSFKMYIFNRWGQLMYSTDDAAKGWDGKLNGEACPEGTYSYTSTYGPSLRTDDTETKRGVFALIR